MKRQWDKKLKKGLELVLLGTIACLFCTVGIKFSSFFLQVIQSLWIPLLGLLGLMVYSYGREQFFPGLKRMEKPAYFSWETVVWVLRIIKTQLIFLLIMLSAAVVAIPGYLHLAPAPHHTNVSDVEVLSDFITTNYVLWGLYPFLLAIFTAILLGVFGAKDKPTMSSVVNVLWGKQFFAQTKLRDAFCDGGLLIGFLLGLLTFTSLLAICISDLIGHYFGINMTFELTLRTSAIGFVLSSLPFSGAWLDFMARICKARSFSLTRGLIIMAVGIAVLFVIMVGLIEQFLLALQHNPHKTFALTWPFQVQPSVVLKQLIGIVATFSAPVWGIYLALISSGRTIRSFLLISLLVPAFVGGGAYLFKSIASVKIMNVILQPLFMYPWSLLLGIFCCLVILGLWRKKSLWLKGLILISQNASSKKLFNFRRIVNYGATYVPYMMLIWIYVGMYGIQTIYSGFLVAALVLMVFVMGGVGWYTWLDKLASVKLNKAELDKHYV